MREPKKDRNPAKGHGLIIGNQHKTGTSNLGNLNTPNKEATRRILAEMIPTLKHGYITYLRVCRALESNFEGVQDEG